MRLKGFLFPVMLLGIFISNALHESYPDEFDNILGGWYILHGRLPYIGFFSHHGPIAYFAGSLPLLFSGNSFFRFRIIYGLMLGFFILWVFRYLKTSLNNFPQSHYKILFIGLGILSTYYWMQMLLADSLAALLLLPVYILLICKIYYHEKLNKKDLILISVLSSLAIYAAMTYLYVYLSVISGTLLLYFRRTDLKLQSIINRRNLKILGIILIPHLIFLFYLLATGSLSDYYRQNIVYNTKYYIYNAPAPGRFGVINPARHALMIIQNFLNNFWPLSTQIKNFNFSHPVNVTFALANTAVIIFFIIQGRSKLALFVFFLLALSTARSNPLDSKETDYQAAVYLIFSYFNLFFVFYEIKKFINQPIEETSKRLTASVLLVLISVYGFFFVYFVSHQFFTKVFNKYMGTAPLIYDRPQIAPVLNSITAKNEITWVGPWEFEELFYLKRDIPSKYHNFIRGFSKDKSIQEEILADFSRNPPKVFYFDSNFSYLGTPAVEYAHFFLDFINKNYITPYNYGSGSIAYRSVPPVAGSKMDLETKLFIRKDSAHEIIRRLIESGYMIAERP